MNPEKEYYPKNGWFTKYDKFPRFGGFSFSFGIARELSQHCMDGYDNPITHTGYETYLYFFIFDRQFQIGYKSVKKVK